MIVIQHAAPMAFQERFALLSVSREHRTNKIFVAVAPRLLDLFNMKHGRCVTTQTMHVVEIGRFWPGHGTVTLL